MLDWILKGFLKIILVLLLISAGWSFITQIFAPAKRQIAAAQSHSGALPAPMPRSSTSVPAKSNSDPRPSPMPIQAVSSPAPGPAADPRPVAPPVPPPIDQTKPVLNATHEKIRFQLQSAVGQGATLVVRITALNDDIDRMIEISSAPWSKTLFYDESGSTFSPDHVSVGNTREDASKTRAMLVAGVPTDILLKFSRLPIVRGKLAIRDIKLLQLDVALFSAEQAYRNSFFAPIAVSTPMFRNIEIRDDEAPTSQLTAEKAKR
jgi:hypothetical protein